MSQIEREGEGRGSRTRQKRSAVFQLMQRRSPFHFIFFCVSAYWHTSSFGISAFFKWSFKKQTNPANICQQAHEGIYLRFCMNRFKKLRIWKRIGCWEEIKCSQEFFNEMFQNMRHIPPSAMLDGGFFIFEAQIPYGGF